MAAAHLISGEWGDERQHWYRVLRAALELSLEHSPRTSQHCTFAGIDAGEKTLQFAASDAWA